MAQPISGISLAQDWPEAPVQDSCLYLIVQRMQPTGKSKSQRQYNYHCQWTWLILGSDIQPGEQAQNRGNRYMANMQIMQNLKEANFPGFCQKMDYQVNPALGTVSAIPSASTYLPSRTERILWNELNFMPRQNQGGDSGVLYNAASVLVTGWEDMATSRRLCVSLIRWVRRF